MKIRPDIHNTMHGVFIFLGQKVKVRGHMDHQNFAVSAQWLHANSLRNAAVILSLDLVV